MSAHDGSVAGGLARILQPRFVALGALLVAGVLAGVLVARSRTTTPVAPTGAAAPTGPQITWAAGARRAPDFSLTDQAGHSISLARFRGRPVIVTFIDPLCRNLCPLEAAILARAAARLPAAERPAIVSVSVNQWGNARRYLLQDVTKWHLAGSNWHWAVGPAGSLSRVWRAYQIGVRDAPTEVNGITVHNIEHTEASYVLDRQGNERALFLYPFTAADITQTVGRLAAG